jgi:hypothetical protein
MFRRLSSPLGNRSIKPSRRKSFRPELAEMETRLLPSSLPLHVVGNQVEDSAGKSVVLRGVNIDSLEFRTDGDNTLQAVNIAKSWGANMIRVPVNQDFWFGYDQAWPFSPADPNGTNYRALVDQIVSTAQTDNMYVMLDLHWSDMGSFGKNQDGQHLMPDGNSTMFWQDAAAHFANNSAVLFDPYNEPALGGDQPSAADFQTWRNGGSVMEQWTDPSNNQRVVNATYQSPGIQGLINTIRATGATNIIAPEGLGYATNLSDVQAGNPLQDATGNLMYQFHLYPAAAQTDAQRDAILGNLGAQYPLYIGEWGGDPTGGPGGFAGIPQPDAATWNQTMLHWLDNHGYSWSAWSMLPHTDSDGSTNDFALITDWNTEAPTSNYGVFVQADLMGTTAPAPMNPPAPTPMTPAPTLTPSPTTSTDTTTPTTDTISLVASSPRYVVTHGHTLQVTGRHSLLSAFEDSSGAHLHLHLVKAPKVGHLTLHQDGSFSFAAPKAFHGKVAFQVTALDGTTTSAPLTVTIQVK